MKKPIFLILMLGLAATAFGQKYLTSDIRSKADSILRTFIGDSVFSNNCSYNKYTYYEYRDIFGKTHWERLNRSKRTKGHFVKAEVQWDLVITNTTCAAYDTIKGQTSLVLDCQLQPTQKPNFDFLPDFFWTKDICDLISMEEAIAIAKRQNLKTAIDSLKATIKYDLQTKAFSWEVSQTLWNKKNELNDNYGEREIVTIDAKTGEVLSHACKRYTPIY